MRTQIDAQNFAQLRTIYLQLWTLWDWFVCCYYQIRMINQNWCHSQIDSVLLYHLIEHWSCQIDIEHWCIKSNDIKNSKCVRLYVLRTPSNHCISFSLEIMAFFGHKNSKAISSSRYVLFAMYLSCSFPIARHCVKHIYHFVSVSRSIYSFMSF